MITASDEAWATDTLRDAQDPGVGAQEWKPLTRITLERYNPIFAQVHSRGYATTGDERHDAASCLEDGFAILCKVVTGEASMLFTKWSVVSGLEYDDVAIIAGASVSLKARPSMELTEGALTTIRIFYANESDNYIHYTESGDGGASFGGEQNVGALAGLTALASVSNIKVHCVSYTNGNSRLHVYEYQTGVWGTTNSNLYWPHKIEHIDAITIGTRDLIVFFSLGPMYDKDREAGIYGIWCENGRWSDIFKIDVLDEHTDYAYRKRPMLSANGDLIFLTGYLGEGDSAYSHTSRFVKISKDGDYWSQYMPMVTCPEAGPAKLLIINAEADESWPWSTGQQAYIVGYDKVYESDATRFFGEINTDLQVDVTSRTKQWTAERGVIATGNTILGNHDGILDNHAIINEDNSLLLVREAGYYTGAGAEYAQLGLEAVDFIREADKLPLRHKQVVSRDFMAWARDKEADHYEEWVSQLIGYDNYRDDTDTGYGGLTHTATQRGWWETELNQLLLKSSNEEGLCFATWDSHIMNGQVKAMIRLESASNGEYAGVVFRARDEANLWAAYYDQDSDKIILRQKTGGVWQAVVASSSTLSWAADIWYGIMVDFRYSYVRVFYSADGDTWSLAFSYVVPINLLTNPLEYGYTGLVGYGYSAEDEDEDPGYEPPVPPPPTTPTDGSLLYFVDYTSGHLFRTRNARELVAANVVYEDLDYVGDELLSITLDPWDPKNSAVVLGVNGIWKTTNLDADSPAFTLVESAVAGVDYYGIAASICQQGLWIVTGFYVGVTSYAMCYRSLDGCTTWAAQRLDLGSEGGVCRPEFSSHDASIAWIMADRATATIYVYKTTNANVALPTNPTWMGYSMFTSAWSPLVPRSYHRFFNNQSDLIALYGGEEQPNAKVSFCSADTGTCTETTLDAGNINAKTVQVEGYTWGSDKYWALTTDPAAGKRFHISDDGVTWIKQSDLPGTTRFISGWPYLGERFYACQDGAVAPILISDDRGTTWQAQTGNWADLGYNGAITCCVPVWVE